MSPGSQIPLYFVGGSLQFIAKTLGGLNVSSWLPVSYALAFAALAPFCGYVDYQNSFRKLSPPFGTVLTDTDTCKI
jgi:hypothetical protein